MEVKQSRGYPNYSFEFELVTTRYWQKVDVLLRSYNTRRANSDGVYSFAVDFVRIAQQYFSS